MLLVGVLAVRTWLYLNDLLFQNVEQLKTWNQNTIYIVTNSGLNDMNCFQRVLYDKYIHHSVCVSLFTFASIYKLNLTTSSIQINSNGTEAQLTSFTHSYSSMHTHRHFLRHTHIHKHWQKKKALWNQVNRKISRANLTWKYLLIFFLKWKWMCQGVSVG